jgi:predicted AAA+ superfamily ATPase
MKNRKLKIYLNDKGRSALGRIIVLTGARQTGKTTLTKAAFPNYEYISIEDPVLRSQYTSLTSAQWQKMFPRAILDEIQKEPVLIESIKATYDQYPEPRYVLLGSSQLLLLKKVKESLAGRCVIIEIYPLTLPEMLTNGWDDEVKESFYQQFIQNKIKPNDILPSFSLDKQFAAKQQIFDYYLTFGGYPALVNPSLSDQERYEWLQTYVRTYLERDIRDLADFRNLEPFIKAQKMTAYNTGKLLNYSLLAKEAGISPVTAQKFVQYMELSYQTLLLQPWQRNPRKRLVKTPKLHYLDIGILNAILQKRGELNGPEYESAIIAEIYKQTKNISVPMSLYHLRTQDGREIDLLLEFENHFIAIEIKKSSNINHTDASHLKGLEEILDKPLQKSFVLSNDKNVKKLGENIIAMPAAMFLT